MRKIHEEVLSNGNVSQAFLDGTEIITRDVMPAKNVQSILDENHRARADGFNKRAHGRLVARVPNVVRYEWWKKWKAHHSDKWTWSTYQGMMLASGEHKNFLTTHLKRFR